MLHGMWDLPGRGIELVSPALITLPSETPGLLSLIGLYEVLIEESNSFSVN